MASRHGTDDVGPGRPGWVLIPRKSEAPVLDPLFLPEAEDKSILLVPLWALGAGVAAAAPLALFPFAFSWAAGTSHRIRRGVIHLVPAKWKIGTPQQVPIPPSIITRER